MVLIITSVFLWINMIIQAMKQVNIIDGWTLLDFYTFPLLFSIIVTFLIYIIKHKKKEKSE